MKDSFKIKDRNLRNLVLVEDIASHTNRHRLMSLIRICSYVLAVVLGLRFVFEINFDFTVELLGVLLILISIMMSLISLELFFRFYYRDRYEDSLDGAKIYLSLSGSVDPTLVLFSSSLGRSLCKRMGLDNRELINLFKHRNKYPIFDFSSLNLKFNTKNFVLLIYDQDNEFQNVLLKNGVTKTELAAVLDWTLLENKVNISKERFLSQSKLLQVKSIASDWGYGITPILDKYRAQIPTPPVVASGFSLNFIDKPVLQLVTALSKRDKANSVIASDLDSGLNIIVDSLVNKISSSIAPREVVGKKIVSLDFNRLISDTKDKSSFEQVFLKIMNEVLLSGNVILFIKNLPEFLNSAEGISSDVVSLMEPFLTSKLNFIATSSISGFHNVITRSTSLSQKLETVMIKEPIHKELETLLELVAMDIEKSKGITFTYEAISEIASGVSRYYSSSLLPDSAFDLLYEIVAAYPGQNINKRKVLDFIQLETNIPVGTLSSVEKEKFNKLESTLHKRVVGQNSAISAVSSAMKRARLSIQNPKRPFGSFLFVGPTGVGKTETAKALAEAFFGDDKYVSRIDMTEFQDDASVSRLIGGFENGKVGVLSSMLRTNPFGVVLLDEFEKSNSDVHDLFLQILDEGFFSDMDGKKINAKNVIFIATSNAVSDLVFDYVSRGENLNIKKDEIIKAMIDRGIFKPELINRFDDIILFEPLQRGELRQIAEINLNKLKSRLSERGIDLIINDYILDFVSREGYSPKFGARSMNRIIQDRVERALAERILNGEIVEGSRLEFKEGDFI